MVGHMFQRLFPGLDRGGSSEGTQQGRGLSGMIFCVAIHPELVALDEELQPFGVVLPKTGISEKQPWAVHSRW